jgi:CheY-like chemotaxis protein
MKEQMPDMGCPKTPEEQKVILLEKINKVISDFGPGGKCKKVPEFLKEYEPLKGKVLIMVDDLKHLIKDFVPDLMVATDGNASFIEYTGQEMDELIKQIIQHNPDIVLMDYHLSENLKGSSVIRLLNGENFSGQIIGFSSDSQASEEFLAAGVKGTIKKDIDYPENAVRELASLISKK